MKKLNKTQLAELAAHVTELVNKKQEIDESWDKIGEAYEAFESAIGEYNTALASVTEWRDDIVQQMSDYQSERSDKWQEGEAGQQYQSWIDEWEGLSLDEVELPDMIDEPDFDHIDTIEQLPIEADSM